MSRFLPLAVAAILVSGCSSYNVPTIPGVAASALWKGKSINDAALKWGDPSGVFRFDDEQNLVFWNSEGNCFVGPERGQIYFSYSKAG